VIISSSVEAWKWLLPHGSAVIGPDSGQIEVELAGRGAVVDKAPLPHRGVGREGVEGAPFQVQDVNHLHALNQEVVCKEEAMAPLGRGLGAHETGAGHPGRDDEVPHRCREDSGAHVVGVVSEGRSGEGVVGRTVAKPLAPQASQVRKPGIGDPGLSERRLEPVLVEMGIPPGTGVRANVSQVLDTEALEESEECLPRPVAVPDGIDF
jgi:hypothetical protein